VTVFLPSPLSERVDEVRTRWDPEMSRRIRPHITVVHDAAECDDLRARLDVVEATCSSFALRFTDARCWGTPQQGIYLAVEDVQRGIETIRRSLGVTDPPAMRYRPHVTLTHERTLTTKEAHDAWAQVSGWTVDEVVTINSLAVIELDGSQWREVTTVELTTRD
jgi:2'-5' RNA ligase